MLIRLLNQWHLHWHRYNYLRCILIRLTPGNVPESLKAVEKAWKGVIPEYPLDYTFIDQDYDNYSGHRYGSQDFLNILQFWQ